MKTDTLELSCNGMDMDEAREIAYRDCQGGLGGGIPICDEETKTWCMESLGEDGHPVCVINTVTKGAENKDNCPVER